MIDMSERERCWEALELGVRDRRHPFRNPVVLSVDEEGYPAGRVLTLREANRKEHFLRFHVDRRSPKFRQWTEQPAMSVVFYHAPGMWQVRVKGLAEMHLENDLARAAWDSCHPMGQRTYLSRYAPSVEVEEDVESTYPPELERRRPTAEESEAGYKNFAVLLCQVLEIDSLHLYGTGHQRYRIQELESAIFRLAP